MLQITPFSETFFNNASAGSNWIQTTQANFQAGNGTNVTIAPGGYVTLSLQTKNVVDDFKNDSMIASRTRTVVDTNAGEVKLNKFSKLFGGNSDDYGRWVNETPDGGFILGGYTNSYGAGGNDGWIVKTDEFGNKLWDKAYGGGQNDAFIEVLPTSDGGYIAVGTSQSYGGIDSDVWLVKINETGTEQWNKTYGGSLEDTGASVEITNDSGYIIGASTKSFASGNNDFWLIKTNETGAEQWNISYGWTGDDQISQMHLTSDGGYVMTGFTESYGGSDRDAWLLKTNSTGFIQVNTTFGGASEDCGYSVQQTSDGGYVIAGSTDSWDVGGGVDAWLIKTNSAGTSQWARVYGGTWADIFRNVIEKPDGGYLCAGYTLSYGVNNPGGSWDAWMVETNSAGIGLWYKLYGGSNHDVSLSSQLTSDGGAVMIIYTSSYGSGGVDYWFIKTNLLVNNTWDKTYGGSNYDLSLAVIETTDDGIICAGTTMSFGVSNYDAWLIKTSEDGDELWNKTNGGTYNDVYTDVLETQDGGYILIGYTSSYGAGNYDFWVVRTNSTGEELWNKTYGGGSDDLGRSIDSTSDDGFILTGSTRSFGSGASDVWLIKINETGDEKWNRTFGGSQYEEGKDVHQTADGGFIIIGNTSTYGNGKSDVYIIKTNETGVSQFSKTYGLSRNDYGNSIKQISGGGYIFTGAINPQSFSNRDIVWQKLDSNGNSLSQKLFERINNAWDDVGTFIQPNPDDGYMITGRTYSYRNGIWDAFILKTFSGGTEAWIKLMDGSSNDLSESGFETNDGGYIATGRTISKGAGDYDFFLWKDDTPWGEVVSKNLLDGDSAYSINNITLNVAKPTSTGIRVQFSLDNRTWYNSTGSKRGWDTLSAGSNFINLGYLGWNGSKFYYKVNFHSDGWGIASLKNISLSYQRYSPIGTLESEPFDSGGEVNWRTLDWNATTPAYTEVKFQLRSDTSQGNLSSKNFVGPDGTVGTYYTVSGTNIWSGHNGQNWIQYKAYLITGNGTYTPVLHNVTVTYNMIPGQPALSNPAYGLLTVNNTPVFNWTFTDTDGTQAGFQLVIDDDIGFASINYDSGQQVSSNDYWQFPSGTGYSTVADGQWYWKVRTRDSDGNWSVYSTSRYLRIDTSAPDPPSGLSSDPGSWNSTNLFNVSWINPSDIAGVTGAYYKLDSAPTANDDGTYVDGNDTTFIDGITVLGEGNHTIYIWLNDSLGNINYLNYSVTYLLYDFTDPDSPISPTANPAGWTSTNSFSVSWTNPADTAGIAGVYYRLDSAPTSNTDGIFVAGTNISSISSISVLFEGNHTVYIWLVDEAGNVNYSNNMTTYLHFDNTDPGAPTNVSADPSSWNPTNSFNISWTNPADDAGIVGVFYKFDSPPSNDTEGVYVAGANISSLNSIPVPGDGNRTLYIWLNDSAGNINFNNNSTVNLYYDSTPPGTPTGVTADPVSWTNLNFFIVNWTNPSDNAGIAGVYYKLDVPPNSDYDGIYVGGTNISSLSGISVSGDGNHRIYIWLMDDVGNVDYRNNVTTNLKYDITAPGSPVCLTADPISWTPTNFFNLSWTNPADNAGVNGVYYRLDSPPTSNTNGTYVPGADITNITGIILGSEGVHTVYVWLNDSLGNINYTTNATTKMYYDTSGPGAPDSVTADPAGWTPVNLFNVSWTNPGETSEIVGAFYKLYSPPTSDTDGIYVNGTNITWIADLTVGSEGSHKIYVWLNDSAGNVNYTRTGNTTLNYDKTDPGSPSGVGATPSSWTSTNSFTVSWSNPVDLSGIAGVYYKLDSPPTSDTDGNYTGGADITSVSGISVGSEGNHTVYVWVVDSAGNVNFSRNDTTILYYDPSDPAAPSGVSASPASWTSTDSFTVSWTNPADTSGIIGAYYKLDSAPTSDTDGIYVTGANISSIPGIGVGSDGSHMIYIWLNDNASNINFTSNSTTILYYDSTAPGSPTGISADPVSWTNNNSFNVSWSNPFDYVGISGVFYKLDSPPTYNKDGTYLAGANVSWIDGITVGSEGTHTIYIWLNDTLGNIDYMNNGTTEFYYDPSDPGSPTGVGASPVSWTNSNSFTVSWSNPVDTSGISGAFYRLDSEPTSDTNGTYIPGADITSIPGISVGSEGSHTIYIWLNDSAGNINYTNNSTTIFYYDPSDPGSPTTVAADPASWTSADSFNVSWSNPADTSGIAGVYYKLDTPPAYDTDGTFVAGFDITWFDGITVGSEGIHTVYIWLEDAAGNINFTRNDSAMLYYDPSDPDTPTIVSSSPVSWTNSNSFTLSWSNPIDTSGIVGAFYRLDSEPTSDTNGTYVPGANIESIPGISVGSEGNHTIYVWLNDSAGNVNFTHNGTTNLYYDPSDPAPPTGVAADPVSWSNLNLFNVSWTNPADTSGIAGVYYRLDTPPTFDSDGTFVGGQNISMVPGIPAGLEGSHDIFVWLADNAGNVDYNQYSSTTLYYDPSDPEAPTGVSCSPVSWTNVNSFTISWSNPGDTSGIVGAYYKLYSAPTSDTDGIYVAGVDITSIPGITVDTNASHMIYIWLVDDANNTDYLNNNSVTIYYDSISPDAPKANSASHKYDIWTNNNDPVFNWTVPDDLSGIVGYSFILDHYLGTNPDNSINSSTNSTSYTDVADGVWYFHVKAKDDAGNWGSTDHYKIRIDVTAPKSPTIKSDTHAYNNWTSNSNPEFTWNIPSDFDGSGIAGYSYEFDSNPNTIPLDVVNIFTNSKKFTAKPDGIYYFHIRAKDNVNKWGPTDHYKIRIDVTPPEFPEITSTTHVQNKWTKNNAPSFDWSIAADPSLIAGYSYTFDPIPNNSPDTNSEGTSTTKSYSDYADGIYHFHLRAVDGAGNWGPVSHYTINIDMNSPSKDTAYVIINEGSFYSNNYVLDLDWSNFNDTPGSGIDGYYYSFTNNEGTVNGKWTTFNNASLTAASEGLVTVYVWAKDKVGNIGLAVNASITIKFPEVVDLTASPTSVFRTEIITFTSNGYDAVDLEKALTCEFQYKSPSGAWTPLTSTFSSSGGGVWKALFTPAAGSEPGTYTVRVRYTNTNGIPTDWTTKSFTVFNNIPMINIADTTFTGQEDNDIAINLSLYESDIEDSGTDLVWTVTNYDSAFITNIQNPQSKIHVLTLSPLLNWFGTTFINLTLADSDGDSIYIILELVWKSVNDAPVVKIPIADFSIDEDGSDSTTVDLDNVFSDVDTTGLDYSVSGNNYITVTINTDGTVLFEPSLNWYGEETITFSASDKIASPVDESVKITVLPVNDAPLAVIDTYVSTSVQGRAVEVKGHGVDIDGTIVDYNWTSDLDGKIGNSSSFETSGLSKGAHMITFNVKDSGGLWAVAAIMYLNVTAPDLGVDEVKLSDEDLTEGDKVTITASVKNTGDADATNVTVIFYDGDEVLGTKTIDVIPADSTKDVTLDWEPGMGDHNIRVEVETEDGDVIESDTENNELSTKIIVKRDWTPWIILIIVVIILISLIAVIVIKKKKARQADLDAIAEMEAELEKARKLGLPTAKLERMLKETKEMGGVKVKKKVGKEEPKIKKVKEEKPKEVPKEVSEDEDEMFDQIEDDD